MGKKQQQHHHQQQQGKRAGGSKPLPAGPTAGGPGGVARGRVHKAAGAPRAAPLRAGQAAKAVKSLAQGLGAGGLSSFLDSAAEELLLEHNVRVVRARGGTQAQASGRPDALAHAEGMEAEDGAAAAALLYEQQQRKQQQQQLLEEEDNARRRAAAAAAAAAHEALSLLGGMRVAAPGPTAEAGGAAAQACVAAGGAEGASQTQARSGGSAGEAAAAGPGRPPGFSQSVEGAHVPQA